ncbi:tetratricopeptide repeat protein [bacterium]|nr:tetratricopeptide repeat protein [bacterium]
MQLPPKHSTGPCAERRESPIQSGFCRILFCVLFIAGVGLSREIVTTQSGAEVVLHENHTWTLLHAADSTAIGQDSAIPGATGGRDRDEPAGRNPDGSLPARQIPQTGSPAGLDRKWILIGGLAVGVLSLVVIGLVVFFAVLQPSKKKKPLIRALRIIEQERRDEYADAENLLTQAITAGLKQKDVQEAYFARGYLQALRGEYGGAAADLAASNRKDPAVLYLDLWVKTRQEKYKDAFEIYETHQELLQDFLKAKELMSIVCFNLGRDHWKNREIQKAVQYFDRVRELGVHADKVPGSISDHQVTLGIVALFDDHFDEAKTSFEEARRRAVNENRSPLNADIGLLLCRWRSGGQAQLDKPLTELVQTLEKEYGKNPARSSKTAKELPEQKVEGKTVETVLTEADLLLRNVLLWHAVSLIQVWCRKEEKSGLTLPERDMLGKRLEKVMNVDPEMPDPKLVQGLIDYYFFHDSRLEEALDMLEKSGTGIPEVDLIVTRERKLEELQKDQVKTFFAIVKNYLENKAVPPGMKEKLIERLETFPRFSELQAELYVSDQPADSEGPTIQNLESRQDFIKKRMDAIIGAIKAKDPKNKSEKDKRAKETQELEDSMKEISKNTQLIRKTYDQVEEKVNKVLIYTGEMVLPEEEQKEKGGASAVEPRKILLAPSAAKGEIRAQKQPSRKEVKKRR